MDADEPQGPAPIDYPALLHAALLGLVREVLSQVSRDGLPGEHHFFLTFDTRTSGVELPAPLRARFPEQMTVVLQNQFWNLDVGVEAFSVTLRFGGAPQRLTIPFHALTAFVDPSVPFGLKLAEQEGVPSADETPLGADAAAQPAPDATEPARGDNVVAFRREPRDRQS